MHLKNGVFLIYAPRELKISPMQFEKYNTEITITLPNNSHGYLIQNLNLMKLNKFAVMLNGFG